MRKRAVLAISTLMLLVSVASGAQRIPLDLSVQAQLERLAERFGEVGAATTARYERNREYSAMAAAEVAAAGIISDPVGYRGHKGRIMTRWQLHVDEAVYGCSAGDTLVFSVMGGSVDGTGSINSIAPSLWDRGRFLVFLGNPGFPDSADYFIGGTLSAYHIREGVIERKGVPLSEFVPVIRDILTAREPGNLFVSASDVVIGTVLRTSETTEYVPYEHTVKVVPLEVSESLKGSSVEGDTLIVAVPNQTGVNLYRSPKFIRGETALVFLAEQPGGTYRVLEDTAGKYMLEFTDVFSAPTETEEVLAAMRALSGGQPN